jgi:hypothetical protein
MSAETVTRVVKGPHNFNYCDPKTGERREIAPGEEVEVSKGAAKAFADVLIDPQVLAAQQAAEEVIASVEEDLNEDEEESDDSSATSEPAPPKKPQPNTRPLKAARPGTSQGNK